MPEGVLADIAAEIRIRRQVIHVHGDTDSPLPRTKPAAPTPPVAHTDELPQQAGALHGQAERRLDLLASHPFQAGIRSPPVPDVFQVPGEQLLRLRPLVGEEHPQKRHTASLPAVLLEFPDDAGAERLQDIAHRAAAEAPIQGAPEDPFPLVAVVFPDGAQDAPLLAGESPPQLFQASRTPLGHRLLLA